jgi:hypothetical protein
MDGIVSLIIFAIIISVISSVLKSAKKAGSRPPPNRQFPSAPQTGSNYFDANAQKLQQAYWGGQTLETQEPPAKPNANSMEMQDNQELQHSCEDDAQGIEAHDFDHMDSRMLQNDLSQLDESLSEMQDNLDHRREQGFGVAPVVYSAGGLNLFQGRNELVKAMIYTEIMRPKFKSRQR